MTPPVRIDLFSDTITKPTQGMRKFMAEAEVGDEQQKEDPSVNKLVEMVCDHLGKEDAIYLPSGTMCNQIAFRVHCRPGDEIIMDETAHTRHYETGGPAALTGAMTYPLAGIRGVFRAAQLEAAVRPASNHLTRSKVVLVEQTSNLGGGSSEGEDEAFVGEVDRRIPQVDGDDLEVERRTAGGAGLSRRGGELREVQRPLAVDEGVVVGLLDRDLPDADAERRPRNAHAARVEGAPGDGPLPFGVEQFEPGKGRGPFVTKRDRFARHRDFPQGAGNRGGERGAGEERRVRAERKQVEPGDAHVQTSRARGASDAAPAASISAEAFTRKRTSSGTRFARSLETSFIATARSVTSTATPGGYQPELTCLPSDKGFVITKEGTLSSDPITMATQIPGVFATGDVVTGPSTIVQAMAGGYQAALSIDRYLKGQDLYQDRVFRPLRRADVPRTEAEGEEVEAIKPRARMPYMGVGRRVRTFSEVNLGFGEETAIHEANRCLRCDLER